MSSQGPTKASQYDKAFDYLLGDIAIGVASIGLESGLLAVLRDDGPLPSAELAASLGFDEDAVAVWCRSAYAFEWIDRTDDGGYRLAPHIGALLLDPTDPAYLGGRVRFASLSHHDHDGYLRFLRSGEPVPRSEHDPELLRIIGDSSNPDGLVISEVVLPQVGDAVERLEDGGVLLEVGAGAGQHAIHYATRFEAAAIVGLEYDAPSVEMARANIATTGVAERIDIRKGDVLALDERDAYDVATMNLVLHETGGPAEHQVALRRVFEALKPGGTLVISELPYPDTETAYRAEPVYRRLAGLMLHEAQVGCASITQSELLLLVSKAGFRDVRAVDQPRDARFMVVGRRPQ